MWETLSLMAPGNQNKSVWMSPVSIINLNQTVFMNFLLEYNLQWEDVSKLYNYRHCVASDLIIEMSLSFFIFLSFPVIFTFSFFIALLTSTFYRSKSQWSKSRWCHRDHSGSRRGYYSPSTRRSIGQGPDSRQECRSWARGTELKNIGHLTNKRRIGMPTCRTLT